MYYYLETSSVCDMHIAPNLVQARRIDASPKRAPATPSGAARAQAQKKEGATVGLRRQGKPGAAMREQGN
jgi:hypothetical protein